MAGSPIKFDRLENDEEMRRCFGSQMEALGYFVLIPPSKMSSHLRQVRKCSKKFFSKTSSGTSSLSSCADPSHLSNTNHSDEKKITCCEFIKDIGGMRDRLEIRVKRSDTHQAFAALERDQFANGYSSHMESAASKLLKEYFPDEILVKAHKDLDNMANKVLEILCDYIGYSEYEGLARGLGSEIDTPGVLRILRYLSKAPTMRENEGKSEVFELAIDHTDKGLITLMPHSDAETLQLLSRNFEWIDVEKGLPQDSVVVIIGEQLAYMSNYRLQAVRHRVISTPSMPTRYSMPFLMRAPPDFELSQVHSANSKLSKDILNHVFELPQCLQSAAKAALSIHHHYSQAASTSKKRSSRLMASSLAQPLPNQTPTSWPLLLFFSDGLPSSSTHKRFRSVFKECGDMSPTDGLELDSKHDILQAYTRGWNSSLWSQSLHFDCQTSNLRFQVFLVSLETSSSASQEQEDLLWTVRSSLILLGRPFLETHFNLNSFRLY